MTFFYSHNSVALVTFVLYEDLKVHSISCSSVSAQASTKTEGAGPSALISHLVSLHCNQAQLFLGEWEEVFVVVWLVFWDSVSLCGPSRNSPDWPWTQRSPCLWLPSAGSKGVRATTAWQTHLTDFCAAVCLTDCFLVAELSNGLQHLFKKFPLSENR